MGTYRFVEDVAIADCAIEVDGRDLDDLFETAAHRLDISRKVVSLTPIGNIKG